MKICPNCKQTYENTAMRFCIKDGVSLEFISRTEPENSAASAKNHPQLNSAAPLGFSYFYYGGIPNSDQRQSFGYSGRVDDEGVWRMSFRDDSKQDRQAAWEVELGKGFAESFQEVLRKIEFMESAILGGGFEFSVNFADGKSASGCLKKESEKIWQSFLYEIQKQRAS